jgi:MoaA/NifB/PqqE/SkfB family radical SAM enzyme
MIDRKFPVLLTQIITPEVIDTFDEIRNRCSDIGATIVPKALEGPYKDKVYPFDYTVQERSKIMKWVIRSPKDLRNVLCTRDILFEAINNEKRISFCGRKCYAGTSDIVVTEDGSIYRCWTSANLHPEEKLGNFFKDGYSWASEPDACPHKESVCPQMCLDDISIAKNLARVAER